MEFYQPMSLEEAIEFSKSLEWSNNHNHTEISNYRLKDCIIRIEDLVSHSAALGYKGVCCTDHEALSAHIRFLNKYNELRDLKNKYTELLEKNDIDGIDSDKDMQKNLLALKNMPEDFKVGIGNEIYLVDSLEDVKEKYISKQTRFWHFILIAKDKEGYQQIKQISSESAWNNWFKTGAMERVPTVKSELENIIGENKGHIIASSACLGSELDNLILEYLSTNSVEVKKKINRFIKWCIKVFGKDNFYLEIQPCVLKKDENGNYVEHPQALVNKFMFVLANAYDLKVNCSSDAHYLEKKDRKIHETFLKSDDDEKSSGREVGDFYETTYLMPKEELVQLLSYYLTKEEIVFALEGSVDIINKIEVFSLKHPTIVPTDKHLTSPALKGRFDKYLNDYEYIRNYAESPDLQDRYLLFLIEQGMDEKDQWKDEIFHFEETEENGNIIEWDKTVTLKEKISRINEELSSFWKISERLGQKISAYYVLVRGLIHEIMWKVSYVGVARGSVTGSYVCYVSSITQLNPLKYGLPFWRHSSPLRPELPD